MFLRRIVVGDQSRVLVSRNGRFQRILDPGVYWLWTFGADVAAPISGRVGVVFPVRATIAPKGLSRNRFDLRAGVGVAVAIAGRAL